ncbi:Ubiquitin protein ligase E3 component n-recognin 4 [Cichlidogyrus casuarinus]|uniref:Ubiquitin protein ligase E3 component n-recognin 4 n=1 Tax=Cichlidogyrus casuarinus TaxID=1844966 RepID=A0ABD2QKZ7_9PLAT
MESGNRKVVAKLRRLAWEEMRLIERLDRLFAFGMVCRGSNIDLLVADPLSIGQGNLLSGACELFHASARLAQEMRRPEDLNPELALTCSDMLPEQLKLNFAMRTLDQVQGLPQLMQFLVSNKSLILQHEQSIAKVADILHGHLSQMKELETSTEEPKVAKKIAVPVKEREEVVNKTKESADVGPIRSSAVSSARIRAPGRGSSLYQRIAGRGRNNNSEDAPMERGISILSRMLHLPNPDEAQRRRRGGRRGPETRDRSPQSLRDALSSSARSTFNLLDNLRGNTGEESENSSQEDTDLEDWFSVLDDIAFVDEEREAPEAVQPPALPQEDEEEEDEEDEYEEEEDEEEEDDDEEEEEEEEDEDEFLMIYDDPNRNGDGQEYWTEQNDAPAEERETTDMDEEMLFNLALQLSLRDQGGATESASSPAMAEATDSTFGGGTLLRSLDEPATTRTAQSQDPPDVSPSSNSSTSSIFSPSTSDNELNDDSFTDSSDEETSPAETVQRIVSRMQFAYMLMQLMQVQYTALKQVSKAAGGTGLLQQNLASLEQWDKMARAVKSSVKRLLRALVQFLVEQTESVLQGEKPLDMLFETLSENQATATEQLFLLMKLLTECPVLHPILTQMPFDSNKNASQQCLLSCLAVLDALVAKWREANPVLALGDDTCGQVVCARFQNTALHRKDTLALGLLQCLSGPNLAHWEPFIKTQYWLDHIDQPMGEIQYLLCDACGMREEAGAGACDLPLKLSFLTRNDILTCLRQCSSIARARTPNWHRLCAKKPETLLFLMQSALALERPIARQLLLLLYLALGKRQQQQELVSAFSLLVCENRAGQTLLAQFIRVFLCHWPQVWMRSLVLQIVQSLYEYGTEACKQFLLAQVASLWPQLPTFAPFAAQFVSLTIENEEIRANAVSLLRSRLRALQRHPRHELYWKAPAYEEEEATDLAAVPQAKGPLSASFELEPCLLCHDEWTCAPAPVILHWDTFTASNPSGSSGSRRVDPNSSLIGNLVEGGTQFHTLYKEQMQINQQWEHKFVDSCLRGEKKQEETQAVIWFSDNGPEASSQDPIMVFGPDTVAKSPVVCGNGKGLPVLTNRLIFQYAEFYSNGNEAGERRCFRCRSILLSNQDAYLCSNCGSCGYGKIEFFLVAKRDFSFVQSIHDRDDRDSVLKNITKKNHLNPRMQVLASTTETDAEGWLEGYERLFQLLHNGGCLPFAPLKQLTKVAAEARAISLDCASRNRELWALRGAVVNYDRSEAQLLFNKTEDKRNFVNYKEKEGLFAPSVGGCYQCIVHTVQHCLNALKTMNLQGQNELIDLLFDEALLLLPQKEPVNQLLIALTKDSPARIEALGSKLIDRLCNTVKCQGHWPQFAQLVETDLNLLQLLVNEGGTARLSVLIKLMEALWEGPKPGETVIRGLLAPCARLLTEIMKDSTVREAGRIPLFHHARYTVPNTYLQADSKKLLKDALIAGKCLQKWQKISASASLPADSWISTLLFTPGCGQQALDFLSQVKVAPQTLLQFLVDCVPRLGELVTDRGGLSLDQSVGKRFVRLLQEKASTHDMTHFLLFKARFLPALESLLDRTLRQLSMLENVGNWRIEVNPGSSVSACHWHQSMCAQLGHGSGSGALIGCNPAAVLVLIGDLFSLAQPVKDLSQTNQTRLVKSLLHACVHLRRLVCLRTPHTDQCQTTFHSMLDQLTGVQIRAFLETSLEVLDEYPLTDLHSAAYILRQMCRPVCPLDSLEAPPFSLYLQVWHGHEDFLPTRTTSRNILRSDTRGLGPRIQEVMDYLCTENNLTLDMRLEILCEQQILMPQLRLQDVYQHIWLSNPANANQPMRLVYRIPGLENDNLPYVERLQTRSVQPDQYGNFVVLASHPRGLESIMERLAAIHDAFLGRELVNVSVHMLNYCLKIPECRDLLLRPEMEALPSLLHLLCECVSVGVLQSSHAHSDLHEEITDPLTSLLQRLLESDLHLHDNLDLFQRLLDLIGQHENLEVVRKKIARLPALLVRGDANRMSAIVDFAREKNRLKACQTLLLAVPRDAQGDQLRHLLDSQLNIVSSSLTQLWQLVPRALLYLPEEEAFKADDPDVKSCVAARHLWEPVMNLLRACGGGDIACNDPRFLEPSLDNCSAEDCCRLLFHFLHKLETGKNTGDLGLMAEDLLNEWSIDSQSGVGQFILDLRKETKVRNKQRAQVIRERQLASLNMKLNEKGQLVMMDRSKLLERLTNVDEEKGLCCAICHEGWKTSPDHLLGVYVYVKKRDEERGYCTLTMFTVIHFDCHSRALANSSDGEWAVAQRHNRDVQCNCILPIYPPTDQLVPDYATHLGNYRKILPKETEEYPVIVHNIEWLLRTLATRGKQFHLETGGGSREANLNLLPHLMQVVIQALLQNNAAMVKKELLANLSASNSLYQLALALHVLTPEEWESHKVVMLKNVLRHVRETKSGTDIPFADYKDHMCYFGLVNAIYNKLLHNVKCEYELECPWPTALRQFIRTSDDVFLAKIPKLIENELDQDLLNCDSLEELCDLTGLLGKVGTDELLAILQQETS